MLWDSDFYQDKLKFLLQCFVFLIVLNLVFITVEFYKMIVFIILFLLY